MRAMVTTDWLGEIAQGNSSPSSEPESDYEAPIRPPPPRPPAPPPITTREMQLNDMNEEWARSLEEQARLRQLVREMCAAADSLSTREMQRIQDLNEQWERAIGEQARLIQLVRERGAAAEAADSEGKGTR